MTGTEAWPLLTNGDLGIYLPTLAMHTHRCEPWENFFNEILCVGFFFTRVGI